jgi:glycerol-3-phosphate acyltransferase PlsX
VTDAWSSITDDRVVRVVVDAAGGDNAPEEVVKGALAAAGPQLQVVFVGDEARVRRLLPAGVQNVSVVHAPDVIGYDEEPAAAARAKIDSSIVVGLKMVHRGEADAFVSAGNTGAVVAASVLHVRRIPGVKRPAICTIMPAMPAPVAFLDVGANAECRAEFLRQFAIMGQAFAREVMGIPEPTIGLLSIGEEPSKGTPEVVEAHQLIAADARVAHFYGNIEGRDIMNRLVDVVVTDGFTGNVGLKTIEGTAKAITGALRATIMLNAKTKLGGLLIQKDLQVLNDALNPEEFGGALLVGMNAPVIIAHGNSRARGIAQAVRMGRRGVVTGLLPTIARELGAETAAV